MTTNHTFKKGDTVYTFSISPDNNEKFDGTNDGRALVCAQALTITSMGKRQGTAIFTEGGQVTQRRIYPETRLVADIDTVRLHAIAEGLSYSATHRPRIIKQKQEWLAQYGGRNLAATESAKRDIEALENTKPSVRIWIHDGKNIAIEVIAQ